MKKAIIFQVVIFIAAYFAMTPDQLIDNTHLFWLFGSYDVVAGNVHWILLGAAGLSVLNIWFWWPKAAKQTVAAAAAEIKESVKAEEAKAEEAKADPIIPKMD